jgi:hypothetical protein
VWLHVAEGEPAHSRPRKGEGLEKYTVVGQQSSLHPWPTESVGVQEARLGRAGEPRTARMPAHPINGERGLDGFFAACRLGTTYNTDWPQGADRFLDPDGT